ncbi:MAG: hypothetical protein ACM34I_02490, partial [bacterium]
MRRRAVYKEQRETMLRHALDIVHETRSRKLFLFLDTVQEYRWFLRSGFAGNAAIVLVLPKEAGSDEAAIKNCPRETIWSWSGNQTRFSRIKYAFLHGVLQGIIEDTSRVVCVLGPAGKSHIDTITIHDLALSWSEEFPFEVRSLIQNRAFSTVMAVVDIALDIG